MRIFFKVLFALILLIIITLITVPFFIVANDYKPEITDAVKKATGRTLTIEGDINFSLFPWIVVDLGALSLSNAEGFTADNFAKVNAAKVSVKLIPLLSKTIELDTIVLDGLVLNLEKNKAGSTNLDDLSGSSKEAANSEDSKETTTASKSVSPALNGFSLGGIDISDANIFWLDATAENYHIENINLKTGAVEIGKPTTVKFSTTINAPSLPNGKADISLDTIISVDMAAQSLSLNDLVLAVQDFVLTGEVNVSQLNSGSPAIKGQLAIAPFNFRALADDLAIELPPMADPTTLTLIKLATDFTASSQSFTTSNLAVTLDQTTLSGDFGATLATQALSFALVLDEIDVDRYLPPSSEASNKPAPEGKPAATADDSLPLEALRAINAKGTFDIGKLKVAKINSSNIHLEVDGHDGLVKLSPLSAELYQGHYKGDINLDARGKTLKVSINELLDKVQVEPLLTDMKGEAPISGTTMFQAKLTGDGATVAQIKQSLNGSGKFSFLDGAVKGVNIAESIRQAKAAMKGKSLPKSDAPQQTDFASLTGSFKMTKGVVDNQDLAMMSPLLRIHGAGKVDLPKEGIDYKLKVSIVETSSGQAGKELADLNGLTIPVQISGTFDNPKPSVDMAELATEEVKSKASKELGKLLGDKEDDSSAGDLLKKFF